jgi:hypothetical protein
MTTVWTAIDKAFHPSWLGFLPDILLAEDKRPVKAQLEDRYAHGGGFRPIAGMKLNRMTMIMHFPGDPPYVPAAWTQIGEEKVYYYPLCSLLLILQPDHSWEVTRVD